MSGCDYLENIKGIGFQRILKAFNDEDKLSILEKMFSKSLDQEKYASYRKQVQLVKLCFQYQIVYYEKGKNDSEKLINLTPVPSKLKTNKNSNIEDYIGGHFKNVESYIRGERNFQNENEIRVPKGLDFDMIMRFFSFAPRPGFGLLSNLSEKTIGYSNFNDFNDFLKKHHEENYFERMQKMKDEVVRRNESFIRERQGTNIVAKSVITASTAPTIRKRKITKLKRKSKRLLKRKTTLRKTNRKIKN